jgi:hypothetical protein
VSEPGLVKRNGLDVEVRVGKAVGQIYGGELGTGNEVGKWEGCAGVVHVRAE